MYIKTNRLELRNIDDNDKDLMILMFDNDIIKKTYMLPDFKNEEEMVKLFNVFKKLSLSDDRVVCGIYYDNKIIGFINDVGIENKIIELGYVINPDYHNKGFASEALVAMINYLFEKDYEEIVAGAFEENIASIRVMEKSGMIRMDKVEEIEYRGRVHNCVYYGIKRNNS